MKIFTIGFTKKNAEQFFGRLKAAGLSKIIDIRLNNVSQLAGFTKKDDLRFFLREILGIDYVHEPQLAPTKDILDAYKKNGGNWDAYERGFLDLLSSRHIEKKLDKNTFAGACLLCSEANPEHCHRRLVAEYLRDQWNDVEIRHL
ncbi:MAG: DUF488 domain-containing protein [Desulfobulbaceae bacterium]|jgi:uncharacterized protein (DUF488 family)|nr:DUF488 domain-containing protein [Desulfobulbaceae bacterium]